MLSRDFHRPYWPSTLRRRRRRRRAALLRAVGAALLTAAAGAGLYVIMVAGCAL
jgi:hypothetical protein